MVNEGKVTNQVTPKMKRIAAQRAREEAKPARWDLDVAVMLFAVLMIVIILLFGEVAIKVVVAVAFVGLVMAWLMGWAKGRQAYKIIYGWELSKLIQEADAKAMEDKVEGTMSEREKRRAS